MKIFVGFFILLILAQNLFAMPLVLKTTKEIKNPDENVSVEITSLDISKYKQIRVGAIMTSGTPNKYAAGGVSIQAVEDQDLISIGFVSILKLNFGSSTFVNNLPNKIKLSTRESGTYKIFIWAE